MQASAVQREGAMPVYQAAVDFQSAEYIYTGTPIGPISPLLTLTVPRTMPKRMLYWYASWASVADATSSGIFFEAQLFCNLTSIGKLPLQQIFAKDLTKFSRSALTLANGITNPTVSMQNNLAVTFAGRLGSETQSGVLMAPFIFEGVIDKITLNYVRDVNVSKIYRAILACISTL